MHDLGFRVEGEASKLCTLRVSGPYMMDIVSPLREHAILHASRTCRGFKGKQRWQILLYESGLCYSLKGYVFPGGKKDFGSVATLSTIKSLFGTSIVRIVNLGPGSHRSRNPPK